MTKDMAAGWREDLALKNYDPEKHFPCDINAFYSILKDIRERGEKLPNPLAKSVAIIVLGISQTCDRPIPSATMLMEQTGCSRYIARQALEAEDEWRIEGATTLRARQKSHPAQSHFDLCLCGVRWAMNGSWDVAAPEVHLDTAVADVLLVDANRVGIIEVKRTRSDLLSDLRAKKMLKYTSRTTHLWLLLGPEIDISVAKLTELGLPTHWGILRASVGGVVTSRRTARRHSDEPKRKRDYRRKATRSLTWRALKASGQGWVE